MVLGLNRPLKAGRLKALRRNLSNRHSDRYSDYDLLKNMIDKPSQYFSRGPHLDEIDRHLLEILQTDASLSVAQMAERVGLSATPCWKRIQKLESTGVIRRRVAVLDPRKIGMGLSVFIAVEAGDHTPEWLKRFAETVGAMPEVMELCRMAGQVDYMLRVAVADMAEFDAFYKRLIEAAPLKNVTSLFAMEQMKLTTAYPLHGNVFRDRRAGADEAEE